MLGPREAVRNLRGFDWSHRVPHAAGGTGAADNGIFERAWLNRKRGAVPMTAHEVEAASRDLARVGVAASLRSLGRASAFAAVSAAVVESVFSTVDHGTRYRRGEITARQAAGSVARDTASAAAGAALATAAVVGTCVVFPPAAVVLGGKVGLALGTLGVGGTAWRGVRLVSRLLYGVSEPGLAWAHPRPSAPAGSLPEVHYVSYFTCQIGVRTASTSTLVTSETGRLPMCRVLQVFAARTHLAGLVTH